MKTHPHESLCQLLEQEKERMARLWSKRVVLHLDVPLPSSELRAPLVEVLDVLLRLLKTRGEDALRLWPQALRAHAQKRYNQGFAAEDLARELKSLHEVTLFVYSKRKKYLEPEMAQYLAELFGEASADLQASYARVIRTEEVRFKEASLMESILHHVDIGIWLAEPDGSVVYATPAVGRLLGVTEKTLLGGPQLLSACLAQVQARHLDGRAFRHNDMPFYRAVHEERPILGEWMKFQRPPSGEEVWVELSAVPIWAQNSTRHLLGVVQTMTDRTQTARKTEELAKAYEDLRRLQGRLLKRTRAQALGQLAGGAAHALNNLLNVLRLRLELLKREYRPEFVTAMDKTVNSIGDLVARLQEFSVAREEPTLEDIQLDRMVKEAFELVELDEAKEVDIQWELESLGTVKADAPVLREVVLNLLEWALSRSQAKGRIDIRTQSQGAYCVLEIKDEGPSLTHAEIAQWFEPWSGKAFRPRQAFFLSLGKRQIEQWGGTMECHARSDHEGVVCEVRIPKVASMAAEPSLAPPLH